MNSTGTLPATVGGQSASELIKWQMQLRAAIIATDYLAWRGGSSTRILSHLNPPESLAFRADIRCPAITPQQPRRALDHHCQQHLELGLATLQLFELASGDEVYIGDVTLADPEGLTTNPEAAEHRFFTARHADTRRLGIILAVISTAHFTGPDHKTDLRRYSYAEYWVRPYWLRLKHKAGKPRASTIPAAQGVAS